MNGMHHAGTQWPLSWPLVLAELLMFGLAAFCRWIAPIEPSASPALERRSIQMIRICALLYLAYAPVVFLFEISTMAATDLPSAASLAGPVLLDSHIGHVWLCRFVVLAFLLFLVWSFSASPARLTAICLAAFALLFLRSFQTHAVDKGLTMVAVNTIHQAAAGLWFGSLMALLLGSGSANPMLEGWRLALTARVSRAAGWCVAVIVVSGSYFALRELGFSLDRLRFSEYGRVLIYKLLTAAVVVTIGGYNRVRLMPRNEASASPNGRAGSLATIRRNVMAECIIIAGVLYWSAVLANTPPPH